MKYSKFYKNPYKKVRGTIAIEKFNNLIDNNKTKKVVEICEKNYYAQIKELVSDVLAHPLKRFINIAGPTSSGKTTTAHNIMNELEKRGHKAILISLDDFLIPLDKRPLLENGEIDYESINTIDLAELNKFYNSLINKGYAMVPEYDFIKGDRKPHKHKISIEQGEFIIVEGLHALNEKVVADFKEYVYKTYICPYNDYYYKGQLVLEAKTVRLMRRCIRDFHKRGDSVDNTLNKWQTITDSEYVYIKPYRFMCDYFINSSIDYEPCVYATCLKPLLDKVQDSESTWNLFRALDKFAKLEMTVVPENSLLWEFLKTPKK